MSTVSGSAARGPIHARASDGKGDSFAGVPVRITNKLSVPLDIYDVFNPASSGQTAPYLYTKLGTVPAGQTGTVTTTRQVALLEAMYTGTIPELQGWYYFQFPIKLMSGTQFTYDNPPLLSYTIVDSDRQSMIQSFLFHKFAMANPDSALTKNLNAALKSSEPKAVNAFFAGTQNFKSCTLSSWNAVMAWLTMFASGWQGPFYLYEAAPPSPPREYVPVLVGTLNIASTSSDNSATLALCSQDAGGNLHSLNPAQTSTVVMAGDGTMVDGNPGQDVSLTLTPVWMNTIQTTMNGNQPQTSYLSGPVVTGTVVGKKVVSTQTLMPLPGQSKSARQVSPQVFNTICQVVGLIVGVVMLYQMARQHQAGKQTAREEVKRKATSESDYEERVNILDEAPDNGTADIFDKNDEILVNEAEGVSGAYTQASGIQQREVLTDTVDGEEQSLNDRINTQLENGETPTPAFETAVADTAQAFETARQEIDAGNLSAARTTISDAATSLQHTLEQNASQMQESEVRALQNSADAVSNATDQADTMSKAQDQHEQDMDNEETDSGAPDGDSSPETEPIPEEF